jgi:hypothetical protein
VIGAYNSRRLNDLDLRGIPMLRDLSQALHEAWHDLSASFWPPSAGERLRQRLARLDDRLGRLQGRLRGLSDCPNAYARTLARYRALHERRAELAGRAAEAGVSGGSRG